MTPYNFIIITILIFNLISYSEELRLSLYLIFCLLNYRLIRLLKQKLQVVKAELFQYSFRADMKNPSFLILKYSSMKEYRDFLSRIILSDTIKIAFTHSFSSIELLITSNSGFVFCMIMNRNKRAFFLRSKALYVSIFLCLVSHIKGLH